MAEPTKGSSWRNVSTHFFRILKWLCLFLLCCSRYVDRLHTLAGSFVWKSETIGARRFAVSFFVQLIVSYSIDAKLLPQLYVDGEDDSSPIAYSRAIHDPPTIGLTLKPGWDHILVEIITSFLVLEYKYRMEHKEGRDIIYTALTGFNFVD